MKQEILNILGKNRTTPAVFNKQTLETYAIYTYRGDVFCLKDGIDFEFDEISDKGQADVLSELKAGAYVFDKSFQG